MELFFKLFFAKNDLKKAGTDSPTRSFYGGSRPNKKFNFWNFKKKKQTYKPGSVHIEFDFNVTLSFI